MGVALFFVCGSITTWDELIRVFLAKFFPPGKTASLRNQTTSFLQREDESLDQAWERFKDILNYVHMMVFKG